MIVMGDDYCYYYDDYDNYNDKIGMKFYYVWLNNLIMIVFFFVLYKV